MMWYNWAFYFRQINTLINRRNFGFEFSFFHGWARLYNNKQVLKILKFKFKKNLKFNDNNVSFL